MTFRDDVAPNHAERLKLLAREGFYDDVPFHRVIDGFMAQTGDGEFGDGTGGSEHPDLKAEFSKVPFKRGIVGMARTSNPHSANSQFFIMFDEGSFLNGQYTVVGEVVAGMDVIDKLKRGEPPTDPDRIVQMQVATDVGVESLRGRRIDDRSSAGRSGFPRRAGAASTIVVDTAAVQRAQRPSVSSVVLQRLSSRTLFSRSSCRLLVRIYG